MGLIHDIPSCHELLSRIEREAEQALAEVGDLIATEKTTTGNQKYGDKEMQDIECGGVSCKAFESWNLRLEDRISCTIVKNGMYHLSASNP